MLLRSRRVLIAGLLGVLLYGATPAGANDGTPSADRPAPHIALALPLDSPAFGRAADAVRQGFVAAARAQPDLDVPVVVYPMKDEPGEVPGTFARAREAGARVVVGPLTRAGAAGLLRADRGSVRALALNLPQDDPPLPENLYAFSLQIEHEARQVARHAFELGRRSAITVNDASALAQRSLRAFGDEFTRLGGGVHARFAFSSTPANLAALRDATASGRADVAFLALDGQRARLVRPHIDASLAVFATSQVFERGEGAAPDLDLDGVRFVDMPWLLQPDHPAVMVYPRRDGETGVGDFDRLYAFGIDAFRIALDLARTASIARVPLDGVTGRISLAPGRVFVRELTPAQFRDGRPVAAPERP